MGSPTKANGEGLLFKSLTGHGVGGRHQHKLMLSGGKLSGAAIGHAKFIRLLTVWTCRRGRNVFDTVV